MTVEGQRYLEECRKVLKEEQMDAVSMGLDFGLPVSDIQKVVKSNQEAPVMKAIIIGLMEGIGEIDFLCEGNYNQFQVREIVEGLKNGLDLEEVKTYADDISITPLAIPMLCGPGAIANAIMLMDDASTFTLKGTLIGIIALVYFITFLILQASTRLVRILGETGNNVMMRLMGLILMVIAVECFVSGFRPILIDIIQSSRI